MVTGTVTLNDVRRTVADIADPELPVVSIGELGILRDVTLDGDRAVVTITPTYSGCPAMDTIRYDIRHRLVDLGVSDVDIRVALAPAWTTDWISVSGKAKLAAAGIAPPGRRDHGPVPVALAVRCPRCGSPETVELSRFSATACTALWRCRACGEPFDRVKEH